jgi:hypothetical protein
MEALYRYVDEAITARAGELTAIADAIWDHPETRLRSSGQPNGWPSPLKPKVSGLP